MFTWFNSHVTFYTSYLGFNYVNTLGFILICLYVIQLVSGLQLSLYYNYSLGYYAFDSIQFIMKDVNIGYMLRISHIVGSSFYMLFLWLHLLRGLFIKLFFYSFISSFSPNSRPEVGHYSSFLRMLNFAEKREIYKEISLCVSFSSNPFSQSSATSLLVRKFLQGLSYLFSVYSSSFISFILSLMKAARKSFAFRLPVFDPYFQLSYSFIYSKLFQFVRSFFYRLYSRLICLFLIPSSSFLSSYSSSRARAESSGVCLTSLRSSLSFLVSRIYSFSFDVHFISVSFVNSFYFTFYYVYFVGILIFLISIGVSFIGYTLVFGNLSYYV